MSILLRLLFRIPLIAECLPTRKPSYLSIVDAYSIVKTRRESTVTSQVKVRQDPGKPRTPAEAVKWLNRVSN